MIPLPSPIYARVSDANGEIAKLSLQRRHFQPGENIVGLVDFRETPKAARICCQFSVALVSMDSFLSPLSSSSKDSSAGPEDRNVQAQHKETCYGTDAISFNLEVPPNVIPTFSTPFCKFSFQTII